MQDNIQNEVRRIDNIAHEIIEAIKTEYNHELNKIEVLVSDKNFVRLALVYRNRVKCDKCFMQTSCVNSSYCYEEVMDYLNGKE